MHRIAALLFGAMFVLLLLFTTLAVSLRSFVFDADFYVATLKAKGVFQRVAQDPLRFVNLSDQIPQLAAVPDQLQQRVAQIILPPDWLEKQLSSAVRTWIAWFVSDESDPPDIEIDLRQIRDRLQGPPGQQAASEIVNAIPACAPDQQPSLALGQLPECLPALIDRATVIQQITSLLSTAAQQLPAQYDIGSRLGSGARFGPTFNGQRVGAALIDTTLIVLAGVTCGMWIIGAWLGGKRGRLSRLGKLLLIGSLLVLLVSAVIYVLGVALLPSAWFASLGSAFSAIGRSVAQAFVQQLAVRSIFIGALLFVGALGLIGWGAVRSSR